MSFSSNPNEYRGKPSLKIRSGSPRFIDFPIALQLQLAMSDRFSQNDRIKFLQRGEFKNGVKCKKEGET